MEGTALVTGADRGLGLAITALLLNKGWRVFAGQYMPAWPDLASLSAQYPGQLSLVSLDVASEDSVRVAAHIASGQTSQIDVMINNAGVTSPTMYRTIREEQNYAEMQRIYNINALGALRVVEAFLPLVERSAMKRLCFVSSEAGSIARAERESWFGYCMSKAALNMAVKILFNNLRPLGYTFRVYHPGWVRSYMSGKKNEEADLEPEAAAAPAVAYFLGSGRIDMPQPVLIDEDVLVMRDYLGNDWSW